MECFKGMHLLLVFKSILDILVTWFYFNLLSYLIFQNPLKTHCQSRLPTSLEKFTIYYKAFLVITGQFKKYFPFSETLIFILRAVVAYLMCEKYFNILAFQNKKMLKVFAFFIAGNFAIQFTIAFQSIFEFIHPGYYLPTLILIILPFSGRMGIIIVNNQVIRLESKDVEEIYSLPLCLRQIYRHAVTCQDIHAKNYEYFSHQKSDLILIGLLKRHIQNCRNSDCICKWSQKAIFDKAQLGKINILKTRKEDIITKTIFLKRKQKNQKLIKRQDTLEKSRKMQELTIPNKGKSTLQNRGLLQNNDPVNIKKRKQKEKYSGSKIIPLYENKRFMLEYIKRLYLIAIKKFQDSPMFYMGYGVFLIKEFGDIFSAFYYFNLAGQIGRNLSERFFVFMAKRMLSKRIRSRNKSLKHVQFKNDQLYSQKFKVNSPQQQNNTYEQYDYEKIFILDNQIKELIGMIEQYTFLQFNFYKKIIYVRKQCKDLVEPLQKAAQKCEILNQQIESKFKTISFSGIHNPKSYFLYGFYLMLFRNQKTKGFQLIKQSFYRRERRLLKLFEIKLLEKEALFMNKRGCVISVDCGQQERFHKISKFNSTFIKLFKFKYEDAIQKDLSLILPNKFGPTHKRMIEKYLHYQDSSVNVFNILRSVFVKNKDQYIFPVRLCIKPSPFVEQGFKIQCLLLPIKTQKHYLICNKQGVILNMSQSLAIILKLGKAFQSGYKLNLINFQNKLKKVFKFIDKLEESFFSSSKKRQVTKLLYQKSIMHKDFKKDFFTKQRQKELKLVSQENLKIKFQSRLIQNFNKRMSRIQPRNSKVRFLGTGDQIKRRLIQDKERKQLKQYLSDKGGRLSLKIPLYLTDNHYRANTQTQDQVISGRIGAQWHDSQKLKISSSNTFALFVMAVIKFKLKFQEWEQKKEIRMGLLQKDTKYQDKKFEFLKILTRVQIKSKRYQNEILSREIIFHKILHTETTLEKINNLAPFEKFDLKQILNPRRKAQKTLNRLQTIASHGHLGQLTKRVSEIQLSQSLKSLPSLKAKFNQNKFPRPYKTANTPFLNYQQGKPLTIKSKKFRKKLKIITENLKELNESSSSQTKTPQPGKIRRKSQDSFQKINLGEIMQKSILKQSTLKKQENLDDGNLQKLSKFSPQTKRKKFQKKVSFNDQLEIDSLQQKRKIWGSKKKNKFSQYRKKISFGGLPRQQQNRFGGGLKKNIDTQDSKSLNLPYKFFQKSHTLHSKKPLQNQKNLEKRE